MAGKVYYGWLQALYICPRFEISTDKDFWLHTIISN